MIQIKSPQTELWLGFEAISTDDPEIFLYKPIPKAKMADKDK